MSDKLIKIFEYALNQEKTGMSFFKSSLDRMGIGAAVSAFEKLIQEEQRHISFLNSIISNLRESGEIKLDETITESVSGTNFFDERAKKEFLEQCLEGSMVPDVTVFNTAWLIEKDLSEFYADMASKTEGPAKDALQMLSKWEHEHEKFFREYRDQLNKVYSQMPWGG